MKGAHRVRAVVVLALSVAAPVLGGCAGYSAPVLTVTDAKATNETDAGLALAFVIMAQNQNDVALPLRSAEYDLELGGAPGESSPQDGQMRPVFRGTRSPEASLRRLGEQAITLPAVISLRDRDGRPLDRPVGMHRFRLDTRLTYVVPGAFAEVLFDTGVRRPVASVTQTGVLDFGPGPGSAVRLVSDQVP